MMYTKPGLSREFKAVEDWSAAARNARFELARLVPDRPILLDCFDQVAALVGHFGEAELVARHGERLDTLDIQSTLRASLAERYDMLTKHGVAAVTAFRETLGPLRTSLAKVDLKKVKLKPLQAALGEQFRTRLADVEIKGSDARKLDEAFAKALETMASGSNALIDMADAAAADLAKMRQEPDRGAQDNIAPWKLINLVAIFAVFLLGTLIAALTRGNVQAIAVIVTQVLVIAGWVCLMIFC